LGWLYILKQIINDLVKNNNVPSKNIFFVDKEEIELNFIKTANDVLDLFKIYTKQIKPKGTIYFFIDEVQDIENWEKLVVSIAKKTKPKVKVYITGSNSKVLSTELNTYLSGRYINYDIYSFSFAEYCDYLSIKETNKNFIKYLESGGLPEILKIKDSTLKSDYLKNIKNTVILKDIVQKFNIRRSYLLELLLNYVSDNVSKLTSANNISKTFKKTGISASPETIGEYLNYLQQAFIIHSAKRYDLVGKRILENEAKYYLNDIAFKSLLFSKFDDAFGHKLENVIYLELKRKGYDVFIGKIKDLEVDFIAEKLNKKIYIQVCFSLKDERVLQRELNVFKKIQDNYEKIIISLDNVKYKNLQGIKHILAKDVSNLL